jgi:hypothetical protein
VSVGLRIAVLGAVTFLGALAAIAVVHQRETQAPVATVASAPAPDGGWYQALVAARGPAGDAERTSCGLILTGRSFGISHPTLPCGARLFVRYDGRVALTTVIDHRLTGDDRQVELTPRLARVLGLDGTQTVDWRFAVRSANG